MTRLHPRDLAALVAGVRGAAGEAVLVVLGPGLGAVDEAAMLAAMSPLALERAPGQRVNALITGEHTAPETTEAAARYLGGARAVTGQVLRLS